MSTKGSTYTPTREDVLVIRAAASALTHAPERLMAGHLVQPLERIADGMGLSAPPAACNECGRIDGGHSINCVAGHYTPINPR